MMHTFKDNEGRTWVVSIHVAAIKRCRAELGIDLPALVSGDGFAGLSRLISDVVALVDVLYLLCRDDAEKRGVSDVDFGRSLAGDAIHHATAAFVEEFIDFFPDAHVRQALRKVVDASRRLMERTWDRAIEEIDRIDIDSIATSLSESPSRPAESSGSTPAHSASANWTS